MHRTLVDAGPLVALLNKVDRQHAACVEALDRLRPPLVTTWPAITEAMYLLSALREGQSALLAMLQAEAVVVREIERDDLSRIDALMDKYRSLPMDFADASLVCVAERENIREIFTLDRRDFSVYRLQNGKPFVIVPN